MKRSKIILGITTCLLAIAGVAAAKHYGPATLRYYVTFNGVKCDELIAVTCTKGATPINAIQCTVTVIRFGVTKHLKVYTQGVVGAAGNCVTPLLYTRAD